MRALKKLCRFPRRRGRLALAAALLLLHAPAGAQTERARTAQELEAVRERVQAVERRMDAVRSNMSVLQEALAAEEVRIGTLARRIRDTEAEAARRRERLAELEARRAALQQDRDAQGRALGEQIRAAWLLGRQSYLAVMLRQEDPATLSRVLTYHQYLARERAAQLDALRAKVERLAALEGSIRAESADLAGLQDRLQREKADLEQARARRRAALVDLEQELDRSTRRLDHLRDTRRELEALVGRLGAGLADIPASLDETPPFAAMAGRLPWPLEGPIRHPFGTARGVGNLSWEGVVLAADAGDAVRAVHHGRVAFAGWLRGYGLLIIVDHGDGFMTLYGHNQSLLKETGDWVATGEVVATAGTSGGRREPGLYFEVRRNATPQDPVRWCRRG